MAEEKKIDDTFDPFGLGLSSPERGGRAVLVSATNDAAFDPFGVASKQQTHGTALEGVDMELSPPPSVSRVHRKAATTVAKTTGTTIVIPPKVIVKLSVHEEVSAVAECNKQGASQVNIEGTIYAQVQCSDGKRNAPFVIRPPSDLPNLILWPDAKYSKDIKDSKDIFVQVPKEEIGFVAVAHYSLVEEVPHMPILLERKVTTHDTHCRIAVQVRSKLTNNGNMDDFTVAVAIPERVDGDSIQITRGEGVFDDLKRVIKWKLPTLNKGESFMVSAQAKLWQPEGNAPIKFPVLLRCSAAADQISTVEFKALPADGHPASVSFSDSHAFRLLHRLT